MIARGSRACVAIGTMAWLSLCLAAPAGAGPPARRNPWLPDLPALCGKGNVLPLRDVDAASPAVRRFAYPDRPAATENVFGKRQVNAERMLEHLPPAIHTALKLLSKELMKSDNLDAKLRELIIVRIGYRSSSLYEIFQHASFAESLGIPREKVASMGCRLPQGLSPGEQAAIGFVDELTAGPRPSDAALSRVRQYFNESQILQIVMVAGQWMTAARLLETAGVELDEVPIGADGVPDNFRAGVENKGPHP